MIDKIGNYTQTAYIQQSVKTNNPPNRQKSFLDKFQTEVKNSADMTDTIVVPRTIFKGYLGIMIGTALTTIGAFVQKPKALSTPLKTAGIILSTYGTWAFVRPYIIKDAKGVEHTSII